MPIILLNKTRGPVVLEAPSLGTDEVQHVRIGSDPKTGERGRIETQRQAPRTVFIPGRAESEELPDAVEHDPEVKAALEARPPRVALRRVLTAPAEKAPPSPDAAPAAAKPPAAPGAAAAPVTSRRARKEQ